jgi:beta-glucanase (GH16 family)
MSSRATLATIVLPLFVAAAGACSAETSSGPDATLAPGGSVDAPRAADDGAQSKPGTSTSPTLPSPGPAPAPTPGPKADPGVGNPNGCTLKFHDEFNALDTNVWNDHVWYESSNPTKNYAVDQGKLKIWPQRDANGNFFNRTIDTDGKYYQTYGYFEISAKLPKGKGTWPAFWLFNHIGDARPEIDIMEAYPGGPYDWGMDGPGGVRLPMAFAATIWPNGAANANGGSKKLTTPDLSAAFHRYAVLWKPNKQTYYFDGKEFFSVNLSMPDPMYIMLDVWFGSASGTPDDSTPQGIANSYEVDWVRAWDCPGTTIPTP